MNTNKPVILASAYCLVLEAIAVCQAAHRNTEDRASEYWGLCVLLEGVSEKIDAMENIAPGKNPSEDFFDGGSNALGGALTLVARSDDAGDDPLIMAVRTLVSLAKTKLDEEWKAFEQSSKEVQHG